ncbi:hemin ABC transporter ATP-binding protein [Bacillus manliponensis]|uniref:Putative hemin import ATP-binding protein HrtA n=1 Tax=Bacillus manliponensis TaxID=574376 RepID=A0A073JUZ0_9BACI|nr:ABC transporter ATP-binding protein [Bacillus manliponensis]KEK17986.1 hemin ABC transporter ATP-binding protein [Bacillus manliponensis]
MTSLLQLNQVSKVYGEGETAVTALYPTSLTVETGEFIGIVGPSGSGKSTLLSIAGALLSPSKGDIYIRDKNITSLSEKEMTKVRLQQIGFIFQFANLVPYLTVKEQLLYIAKLKKENKEEANERVVDLLTKFDLMHRENQYPNQLSGGERQRVAIARAFMNNPDIILADEPTASLDTKRGQEVVEMMKREVKERQKAAIMITHDERMLHVCDRIITLRDGRLV